MKKLIIGLLLVGFANATIAQIRRAPSATDTTQRVPKKEMKDELNLTKEQRTQWKQIQQNAKAQRDAIMANDSLTTEQRQAQLKNLNKEKNKNIDAILTDEQREKMKTIKQEMKENKANSNPNLQSGEAIDPAPSNQ